MKWLAAILIVAVLLALLGLLFRQVGIPFRQRTNRERNPKPGLSPVPQIQGVPPTGPDRDRAEGRVRKEIEGKRGPRY